MNIFPVIVVIFVAAIECIIPPHMTVDHSPTCRVSYDDELRHNYETVREIYHHFTQSGQLEANYASGHQGIRSKAGVYQRTLQLKQAHPKWGAGLIWVEVAEESDESDLPSERILQCWFRRGSVQKPASERVAKSSVQRGKHAHEVWARGAKKHTQLAGGSFVSWSRD